jgi:hypothetical protein
MPKVIHYEKAKKKIRDNRRHRYNAYEPYYKGKLGYTQAWRVEKPGREYY